MSLSSSRLSGPVMSPAATSISTCASSSGARCRSCSGPFLRGHWHGALERVRMEGRRRHVLLGQDARARDRAGNPTRVDGRPAGLSPRLLRFPSEFGSVRARSAAIPSRVAGTAVAPRTPRAPLSLPVARPAQPHNLRAVDAARRGGSRSHSSAPPLHRLGPLLGDVVLREPLQRAHELAVDTPVEIASRSPEAVATRPRRAARALPTVAVQDQKRASATRPIAHAAGRSSTTSMARRAHGRAPSRSPAIIRSYARTTKPRVRRRLTRPSRSRPLARASRAPAPSGRYRTGGASRPALLPLRLPGLVAGLTHARGRAPTPRSSRRGGRLHRRPQPNRQIRGTREPVRVCPP